MKIATFNVNGVNGRLPRLLEWLHETSPDIACLQEIKTVEERFPTAALADAGYRALIHGQRSHHGVAILSRVPAKERRRGLPGNDADREARYLEASIGGVTVASVYLPNGNPQPGPKFDYKLAWFERLIQHAQGLSRSARAAVLAGDFNVVPTDADIYNPTLWRWDAVMRPESRAAYRRLLDQPWTDATRFLHPHDVVYTYWDYGSAFRRNAGFRMDFLLLNSAAARRLKETDVDRKFRGMEKASDHAPVWATLAD